MKNFKKGFTLIELLVVIAIIGVLSSVVLVSVNSARGKGSNAAIKTNLNGIRSQAEVYYDSSPTGYAGVCSDSQIQKSIVAIENITLASTTCNSDAVSWAFSSPLKVSDNGNDFWCVDTSGVSRGHTTALGTALSCP